MGRDHPALGAQFVVTILYEKGFPLELLLALLPSNSNRFPLPVFLSIALDGA